MPTKRERNSDHDQWGELAPKMFTGSEVLVVGPVGISVRVHGRKEVLALMGVGAWRWICRVRVLRARVCASSACSQVVSGSGSGC